MTATSHRIFNLTAAIALSNDRGNLERVRFDQRSFKKEFEDALQSVMRILRRLRGALEVSKYMSERALQASASLLSKRFWCKYSIYED